LPPLVRPGGRIVAIDILPDRNYPAFDPPIPTAERIIRLFFALVQRIGGTVDVARTYQTLCEQAGLRLLGQRGWFGVARDPGNYVALYQVRDGLCRYAARSVCSQQPAGGDDCRYLPDGQS
jgi:hypothetical protein